jgi:FkbM family methyltransferase
VLCIEGAESYFRLLERNAHDLRDVTVVRAYLSTATGTISARVVIQGGTGYLEPSPDAETDVETTRLADLLQQHSAFANAKLLKVDIDGMDAAILMAEKELLARAKPVILFEYAPLLAEKVGVDARALFPVLRNAGYETVAIYDLNGEYLLSLSLKQDRALDEIHAYSCNGHLRYLDICAFHSEDTDLADQLRQRETERRTFTWQKEAY